MRMGSVTPGKYGVINIRHAILLSVIVVLLSLNLWRWWPQSVDVDRKAIGLSTNHIVIDEIKFLNYVKPNRQNIAIKRNLFSSVIKHTKTRTKPVKKRKMPDAKAAKSDQRYSHLNAFKLEGVLDAEGRVQAFLSGQDQIYMVYPGERFASVIIAEKITHDGVLLNDTSNGMTKWITLNGD